MLLVSVNRGLTKKGMPRFRCLGSTPNERDWRSVRQNHSYSYWPNLGGGQRSINPLFNFNLAPFTTYNLQDILSKLLILIYIANQYFIAIKGSW